MEADHIERETAMRAIILTAATVILTASPALAQRVLNTPDSVRECLCLRQATEFQNAQIAVSRGSMERAQEELTRIRREIERRRPLVDATDAVAVAEYEALVKSEEPAIRAYNDDAAPAYNAAVTKYRSAVESYTQRCGGMSYDPAIQRQVEANLVCRQP